MHSADPLELKKFDQLADDWWNPEGAFRTLHDINPVRLQYMQRFVNWSNKTVLDVGCGGGILSEAMATQGAMVTGIDLSKSSIAIAKRHSRKMAKSIDYRCMAVETLLKILPQSFDVVVCMEMLEHTIQPKEVVQACAHLVKPNGWVFFSTINRSLAAYLGAVLMAEYVLGLLPKGTHRYERFIKPAELMGMVRSTSSLVLKDLSGLFYDPFRRHCRLTHRVAVNYLMALKQ